MGTHESQMGLPSLEGQLLRNITEIKALGGMVLHSVDATDLRGTLLSRCDTTEYDVIIFPFPCVSIIEGVDTRNSRLLKDFFLSASDVLEPGGIIGLVLLRSKYVDWDVACIALESGYCLRTHTTMPDGFYQSRRMDGEPWSPKDAELYVFEQDL